jgi:hypothetical protein
MAATLTVDERIQLGGNKTLVLGRVALDSSHLAAGEAIDSSTDENFDRLLSAGGGTAAQGFGYVFAWDKANQKLVVGYADNNNASDGPLIAVPDTTDLSALTSVPVAFLSY